MKQRYLKYHTIPPDYLDTEEYHLDLWYPIYQKPGTDRSEDSIFLDNFGDKSHVAYRSVDFWNENHSRSYTEFIVIED